MCIHAAKSVNGSFTTYAFSETYQVHVNWGKIIRHLLGEWEHMISNVRVKIFLENCHYVRLILASSSGIWTILLVDGVCRNFEMKNSYARLVLTISCIRFFIVYLVTHLCKTFICFKWGIDFYLLQSDFSTSFGSYAFVLFLNVLRVLQAPNTFMLKGWKLINNPARCFF